MVITISCAACETSFPVDPNKIPEGGVKVRCSMCAHVFRVERPAAGSDVVPEIDEVPSGEGLEADVPGPSAVDVDRDLYSLDGIEVAGAEEESVLADPDAMPDWAVASLEDVEEPTAEPPAGATDADEAGAWMELDSWTLPDADETLEPTAFVEATEADARSVIDELSEPEVESPLQAEPLQEGEPEGWGGPVPEPMDWVEDSPGASEDEVELGSTLDAAPQLEPESELQAEPELEPVPEPETAPALEPEAPPAPVHGFTFGKRDPMDKARRLARVLVSDMVMYNAERHQLALQRGTLAEDFEDEIDKSWKEFVEQVGPDIADGEGRGFWTQALNDILARGAQLF